MCVRALFAFALALAAGLFLPPQAPGATGKTLHWTLFAESAGPGGLRVDCPARILFSPLRIELGPATAAVDLPGLSGRATLRAEVAPKQGGFEVSFFRLDLEEVRLHRGDALLQLDEATIQGRGSYDPATHALALERVRIESPGLASLAGRASFGGGGKMRAALAGEVADISRLLAVAGLPGELVRGAGEIRLDLDGGRLRALFAAPNATIGFAGRSLGLDLRGNALVRGLFSGREPSAVGELNATVPGGQAGLGLAWSADAPGRPRGEARAKLSALGPGGADLLADMAAAWQRDGRGLSSLDISLSRGALGTGSGSFRRAKGRLAGEFTARGLDLSALAPVLWNLFAPGPEPERLFGTADVTVQRRGGETAVQAAFSGLDLAARSGRVMAMGGEARLAGTFGRGRGASAELAVTGGELLYDTVYLDFSALPLRLEVSQHGAGYAGRLEMADALFANATAAPSDHGWQGQAELAHARLGPLLDAGLREALASLAPGAGKAAVNGTLFGAASFAALPGGGLEVRGEAGISHGDVVLEEGFSARGIELALPVAYRFGVDPVRAMPPLPSGWGRLEVASLNAGLGEPMALDLEAVLVPNRLYVAGNMRRHLRGGWVEVSSLWVDEPFSGAAAAHFDLGVSLDLAAFSSPSLPLSGSIAGQLSGVELTRGHLRAPGALTGTFFEGDLRVSGIMARNPFSSGRVVGADIDVKALDLAPLSRGLGVGLVEGRLNLGLTGLRVAYGQPAAFSMVARSTDREMERRLISLQAVNSISEIGTGSGLTGLGMDLFAGVFSPFPYDRIGFACGLENDMFSLRGLIQTDGVEYIVKRPLLFGVNVINSNPGNTISFSDMLERIRRVQGKGSGAATTSQGEES